MKRAVFLTALALAVVVPATASAEGGTQRWESSYLEGQPAYSNDVVSSPDGGTVFVTGATDTTNKRSHIGTVAYDAATGKRRWVAEYPRSGPEHAVGRLLAVSPDGRRVFVSAVSFCRGATCGDRPFDGYTTVAYDARTGDREWVAQDDSMGGGAHDMVVSPDGSRLYVGGSSEGGLASLVLAYDTATGAEVWRLERPAGLVEHSAMNLSADGSTLYFADPAPPAQPVAAPCYSSGGGYRVVALDASDGSPEWATTYDNEGASCGIPISLLPSPDGARLFITGADHADAGNYGSQTVALASDSGSVLWDVDDPRILTVGGEVEIGLGVDPDGSKVVVFGNRCEKPAFGCDTPVGTTIAYDATDGRSLWSSTFTSGGQFFASDLAVAPDGSNVYVAGYEHMPCFTDCQIHARTDAPMVAYDLDSGAERWSSIVQDGYVVALALSPDGRSIFTAGSSMGSTDTQRPVSGRASCSDRCGYATRRANTGDGRGKREDDAVSVTYDGWRGHYDARASGGSYRASRVRGDTAVFTTPAAASVTWLTLQGPDQGRARLVVDGRARVVDLSSPTRSARAITLKGLKKKPHTIKVTVLGRQGVVVDGFAYNAADGIAQESSPAIRYNGWTGSPARNGSVRASSTRGSRASLEFTGRRIVVLTAAGPAYGRAKVVIDGRSRTVDLYRPRAQRAKLVYQGLGRGDHRITISPLGTRNRRSTGSRVVLDAFVV
jgi:WD40 repeat protein